MSLPLLPAIPLTEGDVVSPELFWLALYAPIYDDQTEYLGHKPRLTDDELSNTAGSIKPRLAAIENGLRVTQTGGLNLNYASGLIRRMDGTIQTIASSNLTAPNNATSFVWVDATGNVAIGNSPPVVRLMLARVVAAAGSVTLVEDLRHPAQRQVFPASDSIKIFGGTNVTDKVCTANEILDQGYYYFRNFTVPAGLTVTIDKFARIYCSGSVSILGTVIISNAVTGAQGFVTGLPVGLNLGGFSGSGIGAGSGSSGGGLSYNYAAQPYGSGGGLGFALTNTSMNVSYGSGGSGGGGLWIEAAGAITVGASALIRAQGGNAFANIINTGTNCIVTGAGGGSGGFILLSSLTTVVCQPGSTLDVRGGNGANAIANGSLQGFGGGGGGGGVIAIFSPATNVSGVNLLTAGGLNGNPVNGGGGLGGGAGGGFGGTGGVASASSAQPGRIFLPSFVPIGS